MYPVVAQNLIEEVGYTTVNDMSAYVWMFVTVSLIYLAYIPHKPAIKFRAFIKKRWEHRTKIRYVWLCTFYWAILSTGNLPFYPLKLDEMPVFQGQFKDIRHLFRGPYAIDIINNDVEYSFLMYTDQKLMDELKVSLKSTKITIKVHLQKRSFQAIPFVAQINAGGITLYKVKSFDHRLHRYQSDWNETILSWFLAMIFSFFFFKEPKGGQA